MQQAPVMKSSGLAPINDEHVHVFGMNLEERVIESKQEEDSAENKRDVEDKKREQDDDLESIKKRKFETVTGEEDEETSFQGDFKLFIWDKSSSNWIEKGRGQLKLNDSVDPHKHRSRLIMRAGGTYRIILNVSIQHSFFKVISSTKTSVRFTDSLNVWAASGSNAKQLSDLIESRLRSAAKQAATSSDLQEDKRAEIRAQSSENKSDSSSNKSQETGLEDTDNGTLENHDDTGDAPPQDQKDSSDITGRGTACNLAGSDNPPEKNSNGSPSETASPETTSEHQAKPDDEDQRDRLEEKHRKQQPEERHQNEGSEEKTEQFEGTHPNEQSKETEDANDPVKKIKLSSS